MKRFQQTPTTVLKIDHDVSFPLQDLDISQFTADALKAKREGRSWNAEEHGPNAANLYDLFAIVEHIGTMDSGHYVAFVLCRGNWFRCDDAFVGAVEKSEVKLSKGYMLFYAQHTMQKTI